MREGGTGYGIGVVTDVHVAPPDETPARWHNALDFPGASGRLRRAIACFDDEQVDAVAFLGDLTHHGDRASSDEGLGALGVANGRLWIAAGNHDVAGPDHALLRASARCGRGAPVAPGLRIAALEIVAVGGRGGYRAREELDAESWGDDLTLLASHFPLVSRAAALAERGLPYAGDLADREDLLARVAARSAPTVVLSGHLHVRDSAACGSVLQLCFPALVEHPFECSIVEVEEVDGRPLLRRRAIPLHAAPHERDPTFVPAVEAWRFDGSAWLAVAYDSTVTSTLSG